MINLKGISKILIISIMATLLIISSCVAKTSIKPKPKKLQPVTMNISAAASLTDALNEVYKLYKKDHSNVTININYGSSGTLQSQIENGAPVDLFISAATKNMDALQGKGLLDTNSRKNILKNKLVLIAPKESTKVKKFADLGLSKVTALALGEPTSVPAGKYAQEALTNLGLWSNVEPKAVYGSDVRQVLTYVETGNVDAGIVYYTDAKVSKKVKIIASAPADSHTPILYPMATIKNNPHPYTSKDFSNFLLTKKARSVFVKYGFTFLGK